MIDCAVLLMLCLPWLMSSIRQFQGRMTALVIVKIVKIMRSRVKSCWRNSVWKEERLWTETIPCLSPLGLGSACSLYPLPLPMLVSSSCNNWFTQKVLPSFLSFIPFHFLSTRDLDRNDCVNVFLIKFVTRFCTGTIWKLSFFMRSFSLPSTSPSS
jgi:hypothetical protein